MTALIVIAVIVIIIALILSVSATFTITYTDKWKTTISVLWFEKDIELTKILDFILFPQNKANQIKAQKGSGKENKKPEEQKKTQETTAPQHKDESVQKPVQADESKTASSPAKQPQGSNAPAQQKEKKPNYFKNIWDKDGIVGIMEFFSNMVESASSAISVLIRGFHIYSLYVKIIVGGSDADEIARAYGRVCRYYYPLKGAVLGGMKVDNYDDWIIPDFIAPRNEYGFQFIGSISIGLLLKVVLSAGKTFLVNLIKNNNK